MSHIRCEAIAINMSGFSTGVASIAHVPFLRIGEVLSSYFPVIELSPIDLSLVAYSSKLPSKDVIDIISALAENDFAFVLKKVEKLFEPLKIQEFYALVSKLERSFRFAIYLPNDELTQKKLDDMYADLVILKRYIGKLSTNPEDAEARRVITNNLRELHSKVESTNLTHEFLISLGLDEKQISDSFKIVEKSDGSVDYVWKNS